MTKQFLIIALSAGAFACAPGPQGTVGAQGPAGTSGEQGDSGQNGANGADAPTRTPSIAAVVPGHIGAGQTVNLTLTGAFTEWAEGASVAIAHEGVTVVSTTFVSATTLVAKVSASDAVASGSVAVSVGDLALDGALAVAPAAWFEAAEGTVMPLAPGAEFSGTIYVNQPYGLSETVVINVAGEPAAMVLKSGNASMTSTTRQWVVTFDAVVSPGASAGVKSLEVTTFGGDVIVPVPNAFEVGTATVVDLPVDAPVDANLESGNGMYAMNLTAGQVMRLRVTTAVEEGFTPAMSVLLPADEEGENARVLSNADGDSYGPGVVEFVVSRSGMWYLTVTNAEGGASADWTYSVSLEAVTVNNLAQSEGPFVVAAPGEGTWFAADIAEAAMFGWWFETTEDSDLTERVQWYYSGLIDGQEFVGYDMGNGGYVIPVAFTLAWGNPSGTFMFRVSDTNLEGGETYTFDAEIQVHVNGADTCEGLTDNTAIRLPEGETGDLRLVGTVTEDNTDSGANECGSTGERPDVKYRLILTERRRVTWFLDSNSPVGDNLRSSLAITDGCGETAVPMACSDYYDGTDLDGEDSGYYQTGGSVVLDPGTYTINVEGSSSSYETGTFALDLRLEAVE
jgi:hypothetical protein